MNKMNRNPSLSVYRSLSHNTKVTASAKNDNNSNTQHFYEKRSIRSDNLDHALSLSLAVESIRLQQQQQQQQPINNSNNNSDYSIRSAAMTIMAPVAPTIFNNGLLYGSSLPVDLAKMTGAGWYHDNNNRNNSLIRTDDQGRRFVPNNNNTIHHSSSNDKIYQHHHHDYCQDNEQSNKKQRIVDEDCCNYVDENENYNIHEHHHQPQHQQQQQASYDHQQPQQSSLPCHFRFPSIEWVFDDDDDYNDSIIMNDNNRYDDNRSIDTKSPFSLLLSSPSKTSSKTISYICPVTSSGGSSCSSKGSQYVSSSITNVKNSMINKDNHKKKTKKTTSCYYSLRRCLVYDSNLDRIR